MAVCCNCTPTWLKVSVIIKEVTGFRDIFFSQYCIYYVTSSCPFCARMQFFSPVFLTAHFLFLLPFPVSSGPFHLAEPPQALMDKAFQLPCCRGHCTREASLTLMSPGVASQPVCAGWASEVVPCLLVMPGGRRKSVVLGVGRRGLWP